MYQVRGIDHDGAYKTHFKAVNEQFPEEQIDTFLQDHEVIRPIYDEIVANGLNPDLVQAVDSVLNQYPKTKEYFESEVGETMKTLRYAIFARSKNIVEELNNDRIELIRNGHSENIAKFSTSFRSFLATNTTYNEQNYGLIHPQEMQQQTNTNEKKRSADVELKRRFRRQSTRNTNNNYPDSNNLVGTSVQTTVMNQGNCGGCWAFSAADAVSSLNYINSDIDGALELSPQQLISCDVDYRNNGCDGGWPSNVWAGPTAYTKENALNLYVTVPFVDGDFSNRNPGETCSQAMNSVDSSQGVLAYDNKYLTSEDPNEQFDSIVGVLQQQAVSVVLYAKADCFAHYSSGILIPEQCRSSQITDDCTVDHAVLAVGYGNYQNADNTDPNQADPAYLTIKNSWGDGWGENGYIRMVATALPTDYALTSQCTSGLLNVFYQPMYPTQSQCTGDMCGEANLTSSANSIPTELLYSGSNGFFTLPLVTAGLSMIFAFAF